MGRGPLRSVVVGHVLAKGRFEPMATGSKGERCSLSRHPR
jgi:hypothetical protein